jgi:hypothetical protein
MSFKIYYIHSFESKKSFTKRQELSLLKITKKTFNENSNLIQKSIDTFHSEIEWNEMWDLNDSEIRLNQNQNLYLLIENQNPIGHVWYDSYYLYNAYVYSKRKDGDSCWFIQETMWDMKENNKLNYIKLNVDSWNKRAIGFWEKLGFEKI